ncbi:hypothetical protein [Halobaculum sp. MBLA0143]|uniref:hypothetical protein n=1 Tax=Halobaculum sp. MBLA0143 TaxID=3079933 RepID=UPI003525CB7F
MSDVSTRLTELFESSPSKLCDWEPPDHPTESTLVRGLAQRLRDREVWARQEVNLWELVRVSYGRARPDEIAEQFGHLLQPDVDLLYCETADGSRESPLAAAEVKYFSAQTGDGGVMPKLADGDGFYAGLGQAMSLLSMGVSYVTLVHFVHFHPELWSDRDDSEHLAAHHEVTQTYADNVCQLIDAFDLPIGYVAAGVRPATDSVAAYPVVCGAPDRSPFVDTERSRLIRGLFAESFNVV